MRLSPRETHLYLSAQSVLSHEESCWWRECTHLRWWLHTLHWGSRCRWWFHSVVDIELLAAPPLRRHHKDLDSVTNKFMCMDYMKSIAVGSCKSKFIMWGLHKNGQNARRYLLKYWGWIFSIDLTRIHFLIICLFNFLLALKMVKLHATRMLSWIIQMSLKVWI